MKNIYLSLLIMLICASLQAQRDTVFWFVAPEICQWSGTFDRPIKLNIASFNNYPVNITISQPANTAFVPINNVIPANGNLTVDLTPHITMIENNPPDSILPYGILIKTTGFVNVYYEVNMQGNNPEIYSLKGKNALGTDFMIPGQNEYMNGATYQPTPLNRIDIVATENNTVVSITPSKGIVGHPANVTFNKNLNAGETYSCVALGRQPTDHLEGTVITSNRPIAITVTDDMVHHPGGGQDLVGDQIVPVNIVGYEYIAVKGTLSQNADKVYILATANNTSIYVGGNTTPITTINRGQTYVLTFPAGDNAIYFTSNQPIYAFQLTGMGIEFGGALLPPIECTGSKQIKYKRATQRTLRFNICMPASGINNFLFNGNPSIITISDFQPVPGTNNRWYYASKDISLPLLAQNSTAEVSNIANFHLGVFEGGTSGGCSYAFFSDYAQTSIQALTNHKSFCEGDTLRLFVNDTIEFIDIQWTFPNNSSFFISDTTILSISLQDTGMYVVNANSTKGCLVKADTIHIRVRTSINRFDTITICQGLFYDFYGDTLTEEGNYQKLIPVINGCDSIILLKLNLKFLDTIVIYDTICPNNAYTKHGFNISASELPTSGLFEFQDTIPNTTGGCDTVIILKLNIVSNDTTIFNAVICEGGIYNENGFNDSVSGTYTQNLQNRFGCDSIVVLNLTVNPIPYIELLDLKYEYCDEKNGFIEVTAHSSALPAAYLWNTGDTTPRIENLVGDTTYSVSIADRNGCRADTSFFLGVCQTVLYVDKTDDTCDKSNGTITLTVTSQAPATIKYVWAGLPDTTSALTGVKSGTYKVTVSDTFCTIDETITIASIIGPVAEFEANPQTANRDVEIQFIDKSTQGDGNLVYWYWDFGDSKDSYLQNPKHSYASLGYMSVSLWIEDEHGCRDSTTHKVLILAVLEFPNIFTPIGNDGRQYFFRPIEDAGYFEEFQIDIYNRWGTKVWSKHCKGNDCPSYDDSFWWDGTTKHGKPVSDGVYYWVVYARSFASDKPVLKNGSVTVVGSK